MKFYLDPPLVDYLNQTSCDSNPQISIVLSKSLQWYKDRKGSTE